MALSKSIPDSSLMKMARKVSLAKMKQIGVIHLGLEMSEIEILEESYRQDIVTINFKAFEKWRDANSGPDAPGKLYELLSAAAVEGLISVPTFAFLKFEAPGMFFSIFYLSKRTKKPVAPKWC